jgi:iron complex outermembrane receptor protein
MVETIHNSETAEIKTFGRLSLSLKIIRPFSFPVLLCGIMMLGNGTLPAQEKGKIDTIALLNTPMRFGEEEEKEHAGIPLPDVIIDFHGSSIQQFNQFGLFDYRINGLKADLRMNKYNFSAAYSYLNNGGFREHSEEYQHNADISLQTTPTANTCLKILGRYIDGRIKLPGSLTRVEFEENPDMADPRSVKRDEKNLYTEGGLDIGFGIRFGKHRNHKIESYLSGTVDYFERATREYKVITKDYYGFSAYYTYSASWGKHHNTLVAGGDLSIQPERLEYYENLGGVRGDLIEQIMSEKSSNASVSIIDTFEILPKKMFLAVAGRFDYIVYKAAEMTLPSRSEERIYRAVTPAIALDYKFWQWLAVHASFGSGFESPAEKQLESPDPFYLYNPDLQTQRSAELDLGIQCDLKKEKPALFFRHGWLDLEFYQRFIRNALVPYEVYGDIFFRNATSGNQYGIKLEGELEIYADLRLELSYVFSQYRYDSYQTISMEEDTTGNLVQIDRDFSGNTVPGIPGHNLNLTLSYKHPFTRKIAISAGASFIGSSGFWMDDLNSEKTGFYDVLNAMAGIDWRFGHFNVLVTGEVNNILDNVFVAFPTLNSANKRFYNAGAPRNFLLTVNIGYIF